MTDEIIKVLDNVIEVYKKDNINEIAQVLEDVKQIYVSNPSDNNKKSVVSFLERLAQLELYNMATLIDLRKSLKELVDKSVKGVEVELNNLANVLDKALELSELAQES